MAVECVNLYKSFEQLQLFSNFNMQINNGETIFLTGASGCGKTTLLRMLMGLESPDRGKILGTDGMRLSAVFQEDRLISHLNPVDNIYIACNRQWTREEISKDLEEILPRECFCRPVHEFSGGMKRRTAIARAMLVPSQILFMDEPTTGLDEDNKKRTLQYVIKRLKGRTLIIATHEIQTFSLLKGREIHLG